MRLLATILTCVLCLQVTVPRPLEGQAAEGDALARYSVEKKSEFAAAGLEALVPIVGHAYAGDAKAGLVPLAVSVGGLVVIVVGVSRATSCIREEFGLCSEFGSGGGGLILAGFAAYLGGRVWGIVSALNLAKDHNTALRERLQLSFQAEQGSVGAVLSFKF